MMRLKDDLLVLLDAAADGQLAHMSARWRDDAALTVVMAAKGYPGTPEKGSVIRGLDAALPDGVEIFHAGTADARRRASSPMAAACSTSRRPAATVAEAQATRLRRRSTASTGRTAFAAATSAGARSSARTRGIRAEARRVRRAS